jgi:hypothetical protein
VLAEVWDRPAVPNRPLPKTYQAGQAHTFTLDIAPTEHRQTDGLLRLMTKDDCSGCRWSVALNETPLTPTGFVRKPLDHPYEAGLGEPGQYACFTCPRSAVVDGRNTIRITLSQGGPATVQYLDLVLP